MSPNKNQVQILDLSNTETTRTETTKIYKIRRVSDGLFVTPNKNSIYPDFTKKGKKWNSLSSATKYFRSKIRNYNNLEIVEFQITSIVHESNVIKIDEKESSTKKIIKKIPLL
jgi:hypothetical protein